ncbi:hypothetical protein AAG906_007692 [Vitis piasezkii]
MDVKTTLLNGDLEEEIYMDQPEGCVVQGKEKKVLYLYNKYEDNTCVVICLYVNDMLRTSLEVVCETKKFLGRLSQYTQSPNQDHWTVVRRVLKYLRGTINYGLCFSGFPSVLEGFCDTNWISDSDDMKSTSGYVFIIVESAVSWKSAKQICITQSTMETEFITLEKTSSEAK